MKRRKERREEGGKRRREERKSTSFSFKYFKDYNLKLLMCTILEIFILRRLAVFVILTNLLEEALILWGVVGIQILTNVWGSAATSNTTDSNQIMSATA